MTHELINFIILFTICSFVNVILNTVKTIVMYKRNPNSSGLINMITYGFYTYLVILMAGDMPTITKIIITMITNYIGVAIATIVLNKLEKDKLWLVKVTIPKAMAFGAKEELAESGISFSILETDGFKVFDCYCNTQKETTTVLEIAKKFDGKSFATENKLW